MCGLAGMMALHGGKVEPDVIERMADALRHRGPDDAGSFVQGPVGLGFRRLSILDLSPSFWNVWNPIVSWPLVTLYLFTFTR